MKKFEYTPPEQPRELILKLGQKITDRIGHTVTAEDPEYYGLEALVTDEMAEVALKMKVRKPMTLAQIVKATGKEEKVLEELLQEMSNIGLLEYNWENPKHEKQYVLPMYVPGSAEFFNMKLDQIKEHPEVASFFERMAFLPLQKVTPMVPPGGAGIGMHVIPVEKAIETENESVSVEHISHWLDKYDGKYAAGPCSCRYSRGVLGEGCADDPEDWCIGVGDMADYLVETNKGHYITREKVMEILQRAEDNGFVHQITNIDGEDKIFAICNCNVNICNALRTSQLFNTPNMSRSAYVAKVETKDCVACGRCVEYCPAGALSLGQKLCRKDGSEVTYPKMPLPSEQKWGRHMWSEDYRDKNRINTHESGTAPCKTACPAHIAVQGYLKMAAQGRYHDALALIKKNNPLPAICGYVCNRRCEDACTRGTIDESIAIDEVKKYIAMLDINAETRYVPEKVVPATKGYFDEKVAIIGAGPAGISCAYYLAEKGYTNVTVFDKNKEPGGMVVYGIPSFVMEKNIVQAEIDVLRAMGVEIKCGVEVGKDITIAQLREQGYKAFYIAVGCQGGRKTGVAGEDAKGVMTGVELLHITTDDESYKLTGDTVVIGGGNVAIDVSRTAIRCGSPKVSQVSLETRDIMPALPEEIETAESEGINIIGGWGPKEILTEDGKVTGIVFKKCTSVKDGDGRFNPQYDENETMTIECSNVIMSVGQAIEWGSLLEGTKVEFWHGNYPVADKVTYQTAEPDIFVGGDVYTGPKFAIDAIAAGKQGAISIHRYVQPHSSLTIGRDPNYYVELDKDDYSVEKYDNTGRQRPAKKSGVDKLSFRSDAGVFTEEQVKKETARCLGCGATIVDENQCVGCGICTTKCEFDAIHLQRDLPECSTMRRSEDKLKYILPYGAKQAIKIKFKKKKD